MLKKIVRYGNSCAIVLDKAIIELLDMHEGSIVKISTDGKTLLLTPHRPTPREEVSPTVTSLEILLDSAAENLKEQFKELHPQTTVQELQKMAAETKTKMTKCAEEYATLESNQEYQKELSLLKEKHENAPKRLINEIEKLQKRYAPALSQMIKELDASPMAQVGRKATEALTQDFEEEAAKLHKTYMAIHKKYQSARDACANLENNEDYQHENALLAQQQKKPIDTQKYVAVMTELTCKYIPEWRAYQDELLDAAKKYAQKIEKARTKKKAS